jgi:hypothetical protein
MIKQYLGRKRAIQEKLKGDERLLLSPVLGVLEWFTAYVFLVGVFQPRIKFG